jgi:hypothetical protein
MRGGVTAMHADIMPRMKEPRYFVVVFGNPDPDKDKVESGVYTACENYPKFDLDPGDMLLLYCTEEYTEHSMRVPGIGKVTSADGRTIKYEWQPLHEPILRESLRQSFKSDEWLKMTQLRFTTRRVFEISKESFSRLA